MCVLLLSGLESNDSFTVDLVQREHSQKMKHIIIIILLLFSYCYYCYDILDMSTMYLLEYKFIS